LAREVALVRAQHVIRQYFKGDLMQLRATLRSLADLVLSVEQHEALAELSKHGRWHDDVSVATQGNRQQRPHPTSDLRRAENCQGR